MQYVRVLAAFVALISAPSGIAWPSVEFADSPVEPRHGSDGSEPTTPTVVFVIDGAPDRPEMVNAWHVDGDPSNPSSYEHIAIGSLAKDQSAESNSDRRTERDSVAPPPYLLATRDDRHRIQHELIETLGRERHTVKIREAAGSYGNALPVIYPAVHWLSVPLVDHALSNTQVYETDNPLTGLLSGLNILVLRPPELPPDLAEFSDSASLTIELSNAQENHTFPVAMHQRGEGTYHVTDPYSAGDALMGQVIAMGSKPLLSVSALNGVGLPSYDQSTVSYVVRLGELDLEIGVHRLGDPKGVIR